MGGSATAVADADATEGVPVSVESVAVAGEGETVVVKKRGTAEGVVVDVLIEGMLMEAKGKNGTDPVAEAIVDALADGELEPIVRGIAETVEQPCPPNTEYAACPVPKAAEALAKAFNISQTEGYEEAFAVLTALGMAEGGRVAKAFAIAASSIYARNGCSSLKIALEAARSFAIEDGNERSFANALDFDDDLIGCIYGVCTSATLLECCKNDDTTCGCLSSGCTYELWKETPRHMWRCPKCEDPGVCICPSNLPQQAG
ncbi:unnamed protein product [Ostreobium quekettii]|uniref:Uncharacterized protein n=1 Tax=Ostreobium quekettii TaxID=121088 RepID=A0A8S1J481_9CHLO|nr:unnamed protein product [Ostreobium quekettii]|eukprot:evm.model.scf_248EXC.12 EVM.evm.TU.scf_248EXC.12   scf_248EXC:74094-78186(+)